MKRRAELEPVFDNRADLLVQLYETSSGFQERKKVFVEEASALLRTLNPSEPPLCFDLGCGPGVIASALAGIGFKVIAVDASQKMIERAEALADREKSTDLEFYCSDLREFLARAGEDPVLLVCSSVLEYLDAPGDVVRQASDRLQPGGRLLLSIPNRFSILRKLEPLLQALRPEQRRYIAGWRNSWEARNYESLALEIGLTVRLVRYFGLPLRGTLSPWFSRRKLIGTMTLLVLEKGLSSQPSQ
jgi:2-polyprenyl-6-hydroxyphenyl methylase/3-demethylubiquinone-9 3-methyltransferase